MAYEIEKGALLPPSKGLQGTKYPFPDMEVGDSFVSDAENRRRVRGAASAYGKRHGKVFATRHLPDGTHRVWRTK